MTLENPETCEQESVRLMIHAELAVLEQKAKEEFERASLNERLAHDCNCDLAAEVKRLRAQVEWIVAVLKIGPQSQ